MMSGPRLSIIPAGAVTDQRLEGRDLQVLALLGSHTDTDGWCFRSQATMARQIGCGRATVQRSLDRLEAAGWLARRAETRDDGGTTVNAYRVVLDVAEAGDPDPCLTGEAPPRPHMDGRGPPAHGRAGIRTTPNKRDERERGRRDDGKIADTDDGGDPEGLAAFRAIWPRTEIDDAGAVEREWRSLTPADRRAALDGAPVFLAALKSQKAHHPPGGVAYLSRRRWESAVKAAQAKSAAAPAAQRIACPAWSRRWYGLLIARVLAGDSPRRLSLMLTLAEGGTGASAAPEELDLDRVDAMQGFPSNGEVVARWRRWLDLRGVRLPVWRDAKVWVFLPSPDPPCDARDEDDDRLAG